MKAIPFSLISGLLVSLALFWLMQMMISNNQHGFKKTDNVQMTEFVRLKRETKLQTKDRETPDEPPPPEKRPPPPQMEMQQVSKVQNDVPQMDMPNLDIPMQTERFSGSLLSGLQVGKEGIGKGGQNFSPTISKRYPITFPRGALNRGIRKCWVKIQFTLTKLGAVKDAKVIEYKPNKLCASKDVLNTFSRWEFKPNIVAGKAIETYRVKQDLDFSL